VFAALLVLRRAMVAATIVRWIAVSVSVLSLVTSSSLAWSLDPSSEIFLSTGIRLGATPTV